MDVANAIRDAKSGPVDEGTVGHHARTVGLIFHAFDTTGFAAEIVLAKFLAYTFRKVS